MTPTAAETQITAVTSNFLAIVIAIPTRQYMTFNQFIRRGAFFHQGLFRLDG